MEGGGTGTPPAKKMHAATHTRWTTEGVLGRGRSAGVPAEHRLHTRGTHTALHSTAATVWSWGGQENQPHGALIEGGGRTPPSATHVSLQVTPDLVTLTWKA